MNLTRRRKAIDHDKRVEWLKGFLFGVALVLATVVMLAWLFSRAA